MTTTMTRAKPRQFNMRINAEEGQRLLRLADRWKMSRQDVVRSLIFNEQRRVNAETAKNEGYHL